MFDREFIKTAKAQRATIDKQIAELESSRDALDTLIATTESAAAPKAKAATTAATPVNRGPRKNYIGRLLPQLVACGGEMSLSAMRTFLGDDVAQNNLNAAIQNELKKGDKARITRTVPGVYAITAFGTAQVPAGGETPQDPPAEAEEGVEEGAEEVLPEEIPDAPVEVAEG